VGDLAFFTKAYGASILSERMRILSSGNVGIGTTSPLEALEVQGSGATIRIQGTSNDEAVGLNIYHSPIANDQIWSVRMQGSSPTAGSAQDDLVVGDGNGYNYITVKSGGAVLLKPNGGNVGIGTTTPQAPLDVNGMARVKVLSITGGADVAEPFAMSGGDIPKGAVVVIDDAHPGQLKLSQRAYDKRVAGIVSGAGGVNPGLTLSQQCLVEGGQNVALTGRVYALADAANGPIEPGDLLTTSAIPGHAMKVTDPAKSQGAIIGKAMSHLETGRGLVLVLVTLQ
jgi:hypothetical protein